MICGSPLLLLGLLDGFEEGIEHLLAFSTEFLTISFDLGGGHFLEFGLLLCRQGIDLHPFGKSGETPIGSFDDPAHAAAGNDGRFGGIVDDVLLAVTQAVPEILFITQT